LAATPEPLTTPNSGREPSHALRADQRQNWLRGQRVRVEDYMKWTPALGDDADVILDLIYGEYLLREELGEQPSADEYYRRFPAHIEALKRQFRLHELIRSESEIREIDS